MEPFKYILIKYNIWYKSIVKLYKINDDFSEIVILKFIKSLFKGRVVMDKCISEINIKTYRGISDLEIKNLGNINILVGDNNSGKTSVLEAIKVLSQPNDIGNIIKIVISRASRIYKKDFIDSVLTIFRKEVPDELLNKNMRDSFSLEIACKCKGKNISLEIFAELTKKLNFLDFDDERIDSVNSEVDSIIEGTLRVNNDNYKTTERFSIESTKSVRVDSTEEIYNSILMPVSVNLYASCVDLYPQVIKTEKKDIFIEVLKIFDNDIYDISIVEKMIWIHNKNKGIMPLFSYGAGMQKALLLSMVLVVAKDGVLLLDEIETALHTSALIEVFEFLIKACEKMNIQVFATTHSIEAVDKMLSVAKKNREIEKLRIITLRKNDKTGRTTARVLSGEDALDDRENYRMELRV